MPSTKAVTSHVLLLCPTLWDSTDCSPADSSVHGILQARILQWLPFPSSGDLPNPGTEPEAPACQAVFYPWATWEAPLATLLKLKFEFLNYTSHILMLIDTFGCWLLYWTVKHDCVPKLKMQDSLKQGKNYQPIFRPYTWWKSTWNAWRRTCVKARTLF